MKRTALRFICPLAMAAAVALAVSAGARPARAQAAPQETPVPPAAPAAPAAVEASPDLIVEFQLNPAQPGLNEPYDILAVVSNVGTSGTINPVRVDFAVDPPIPPTMGSAGTMAWVEKPALPAGDSAGITKENVPGFTTEGAHSIYVWADTLNVVAESNENNNITRLDVFVGDCTVDAYEVDDTCAAAGWMSEETQGRTFCKQGTLARVDEDWVKFTAFAGVQYSLATSNRGPHAAPGVSISKDCNSAPIIGPSANAATWTPAASGVYFAKVHNPTDLGPNTAYSLTLSSNTGVTDDYEPDNTCATARDITADGVKQKTRRFVSAGDQDWVRFNVAAGQGFSVETSSPGTQVSPLLDVFTSCADVPTGPPQGGSASPLTGNSATAQTIYARVRNADPASFGPDRTYDLAAGVSNCSGDLYEDDDTPAQAKALGAGATQPGHTFCPGGDQDWVRLTTAPGKIYVLQTGSLGPASDTVIALFAADGTTLVAENDDYGFTRTSRVVWTANATTYLARVRGHSAVASGPNTNYDLALREGFCAPDPFEAQADNGPGDAEAIAANGAAVAHNFCADALNAALADQDWHRFDGEPGDKVQVRIEGVGQNADPVLTLYGPDGLIPLAANDDAGLGRAATLLYTATLPGTYYVRIAQFNAAITGSGTEYSVKLLVDKPPPPTPTPTPTPVPAAPTPTPNPVNVKTVILVNRARMEALYPEQDYPGEVDALMAKLHALANHASVQGAVVEIENDPAVAAAYAAWPLNDPSTAKANAVAAAVRGRLMTFLDAAPDVKYVVLVGGDAAIPFRRVPDLVPPQTGPKPDAALEPTYAETGLAPGTTVAAALADAMILTDDYYVDKVAGTWEDSDHNAHELYIPDLPSGRLIETPAEIGAFIDQYLSSQSILAARALVTGWDFVTDSAQVIYTTLDTDGAETVDNALIGSNWLRQDFVNRHLNFTEKVALHSINGHSTHTDTLMPNLLSGTEQAPVTAAEVAAATGDLAGTVVYNVGCHGGLNEPVADPDLPQAYARERAHYIGNTGFGWGGNAITYSEDLMRRFTIKLMVDTRNEVGPALMAGKQWYRQLRSKPNAYDAKVLMQATLYGLPMYAVQSSDVFSPDDPFPSVDDDVTPPSAFSGGPATGHVGYDLNGSFGPPIPGPGGASYSLNGSIDFNAGEPVQPLYYVNAGGAFNATVGDLRGVLFTGGTYEDKPNFDPVVALAYNEYTAEATEPPIQGEGWLPAVPFAVQPVRDAPGAGVQNVVMSLGQFSADDATERLYTAMTFDTLYSFSADAAPPTVSYVDGVLDPAAGKGRIKVEAADESGVARVVVACTGGTGTWQSVDLAFSAASQKWTGEITGTVGTRYFVQVADGAGNVQVETNKGAYYRLPSPLPQAQGRGIFRILLPAIGRP